MNPPIPLIRQKADGAGGGKFGIVEAMAPLATKRTLRGWGGSESG